MEGMNSQPIVGPFMDPSRNNQPLQFNKGQMSGYPEVQDNNYGGDMELDGRGDSDMRMNYAQGADSDMRMNYAQGADSDMRMNYAPVTSEGPVIGPLLPTPGMQTNWDMNSYPMMGMMGQMGQMDPWGQNMMGQGAMMMGMAPDKVIQLSSCVLYAPPPNAPPSTTRERPPGCRTIFVGGLPETITVEILRETFASCGEICSIRISKKNFAHIRFIWHESVDRALMISGYRMKIDDKDDKANTGRIHVDFAQARDDQYEFECHQRALMREYRHQQRIEEDMLRPPSPPTTVPYSDHEAITLLDKIKGVETFTQSVDTLTVWLERGDCNRRSSHHFYSLLQSVHTHLRRLQTEKEHYKLEYDAMRQQFSQRLQMIVHQFEQIDRVFGASTKQKAWDHFTKAQRKNLETWRKRCAEQRAQEEAELFDDRKEDEMEMSDNEESTLEPAPKKRKETTAESEVRTVLVEEVSELREENDALKCQLEAYKNEAEILRLEARDALLAAVMFKKADEDEKEEEKEEEKKDEKKNGEEEKGAREEAEGTKEGERTKEGEGTKEGEDTTKDEQADEETKATKKIEDDAGLVTKDKQIKLLQQALQGMQQQLISFKKNMKEREDHMRSQMVMMEKQQDILKEDKKKSEKEKEQLRAATSNALTDKEAKVVGLISSFLNVHPKGASIDYIWSYLQQLDVQFKTIEIEDILDKCPSLFELCISGVGAAVDKRWKFIAFSTKSTDNDDDASDKS